MTANPLQKYGFQLTTNPTRKEQKAASSRNPLEEEYTAAPFGGRNESAVWKCMACTFHNPGGERLCAACGSQKDRVQHNPQVQKDEGGSGDGVEKKKSGEDPILSKDDQCWTRDCGASPCFSMGPELLSCWGHLPREPQGPTSVIWKQCCGKCKVALPTAEDSSSSIGRMAFLPVHALRAAGANGDLRVPVDGRWAQEVLCSSCAGAALVRTENHPGFLSWDKDVIETRLGGDWESRATLHTALLRNKERQRALRLQVIGACPDTGGAALGL